MGRQGADREKLLQENGGNAASEVAVAKGLEWLALHQANDGHWSLNEFHKHAREKPLPDGKTFVCNCASGTAQVKDVGATGLALLPFLGAGHAHKAGGANKKKDYSKTVAAGINYLLRKQDRNGYFGDSYSHGIAAIVLCEAYGLTADPMLKRPAQRALDYLVKAQHTGGGWRYGPGQVGDTSVTGWQLTALKSGQMAGLTVPAATLRKVDKFLDSAAQGDGYVYVPNTAMTPSMTAVGLLCRQYLGANPRNPALLKGVEILKKNPPGKTKNLYYEYYATQVTFHVGGDAWKFWNGGPEGKGGMRDTLIARRDAGTDARHKHQAGSWAPEGDSFNSAGGRIMATSLSLLCLEVYYRHPPLFRRDADKPKD
jgi:hypothetical protein